MCLSPEYPVDYHSRIGYAVLRKKKADAKYYGIYRTSSSALMGERRRARFSEYDFKSRRAIRSVVTKKSIKSNRSLSAGYYGFKSGRAARTEFNYQKRLMKQVPFAKEWKDIEDIVIVKCEYEDVFAIGRFDSDSVNAFRAIYRTILEEVQ